MAKSKAKHSTPAALASGFILCAVSGPAVLSGTAEVNGQPAKTFTKDLIRCGDFKLPSGDSLCVTGALLDKWVEGHKALTRNGVKVPAPNGHTFDADNNRGYVLDIFRDGDVLKGTIQLIGDDAIKLAARSEVSIYAVPEFTDGAGNTYENVILHVALTPVPVIPGQGPFVPIAASRGGTHHVPVLRLAAETTMEALKQIATALGITVAEGMDEAAVLAAILEKIGATSASAEEAAKAKDEAKEAKTALSRAQDQVKALELARGRPIEVDVDALEAQAENITLSLDGLVKSGNITPAVKDALLPILAGSTGSRPAICLSQKAATAAGLGTPLGKSILAALGKNDPATIAKTLGEKTGSQRKVELSRETPGGESAYRDPDLDKRIAAATGIPAKK